MAHAVIDSHLHVWDETAASVARAVFVQPWFVMGGTAERLWFG